MEYKESSWASPTVVLLDPQGVSEILVRAGKFASVSRLQDGDGVDSQENREKYEKIGMRCLLEHHRMAFRSHQIGFRMSNVSRVTQAQLRTHVVGVGTITQSQRYTDASSIAHYCPSELYGNKDYEDFIAASRELYRKLLSGGHPPEIARYCLPQSSVTTMIMNFTPDALFHFLNERLCGHAGTEIRLIAEQMRKQVVELEPKLTPFLVPRCLANPTIVCKNINKCSVRASYGDLRSSYGDLRSSYGDLKKGGTTNGRQS